MERKMKFINVAELRLDLSKIIRQIEESREEVIVTRNGHPVILMRSVTEKEFTLKNQGKSQK